MTQNWSGISFPNKLGLIDYLLWAKWNAVDAVSDVSAQIGAFCRGTLLINDVMLETNSWGLVTEIKLLK